MCILWVTQPLAEEVHLKYQRWMQLLEHSGRHRPNVLDKGPGVIGYQPTLTAIRDEYGGQSGSGKVPPRAHPSMSIQVNMACCFSPPRLPIKGFPGGSEVKNSQEMQVRSLGWEDLRKKEVATHSSILAWEIPCTEEPCGLQSVGWPRVRRDLASK